MNRVAELRDLSDDHHTGLVLARRCRQTGAGRSALSPEQVWKQVAEAFSSHLEPHFRIEEQYLLPALEAIGEASLVHRIREEHRALRALQASAPADRELVSRFGELLEAHIRFEEREVFESTQHRLSPRALESIASACREIPRVCSVPLDP